MRDTPTSSARRSTAVAASEARADSGVSVLDTLTIMSPEDRAEQLRGIVRVLQEVVAARSLLDVLTVDERTQLLAAAGDVFHPDADARRHRIKQLRRTEKERKVERAEAALAGTGIRELRQRPVFHSPNVFPPVEPARLPPGPGDDESTGRDRVGGDRHCYICKRTFRELHHFYDQLCGPCAELNFAKRTETADLRGRTALV